MLMLCSVGVAGVPSLKAVSGTWPVVMACRPEYVARAGVLLLCFPDAPSGSLARDAEVERRTVGLWKTSLPLRIWLADGSSLPDATSADRLA